MSIIDHDLQGQEGGNRQLIPFKQPPTDVVKHRLGDGIDENQASVCIYVCMYVCMYVYETIFTFKGDKALYVHAHVEKE